MEATSSSFAQPFNVPVNAPVQAPRFASNGVPYVSCLHCYHPFVQTAKFCGNCGTTTGQTQPHPEVPVHEAHAAPAFAHVKEHQIPKELQQELGMLMLILARERLFLYMHCIVFLAINIFGFWFSLKAYNGYNCDEITKGVIALTPLLFINSIALACIVPIKGTRREIARLKERITYTRYRIEYHGIF
jgi:hypothetical protein